MTTFVDSAFLRSQGPSGLAKQVERLLWHLGFVDVVNIDGPGDEGGDILGRLQGEVWVVQSKWKLNEAVGPAGVDEVFEGVRKYNAHKGLVVTNSTLSRPARGRIQDLRGLGPEIHSWVGSDLEFLYQRAAADRLTPLHLHRYQETALRSIKDDLEDTGRSLLFFATGLGKTVVAGEVIRTHLDERPGDKILVVAHARDLVAQLERAIWRHLPKEVRTQMVDGTFRPDDLTGVTFATRQTALSYARNGYRPGLVVVDEAHHVDRDGDYAELLDILADARQLGVTATPWRGDRYDITDRFGRPSASVDIETGMRLGYLADVRYRMFADNLDWDFIRAHSEHSYTIRDLNARLFVPQRDEAIRDHLMSTWSKTRSPRAIVFCRSVDHAERMAATLSAVPQWAKVLTIHAQMSKRERQTRLVAFRNGQTPIITAVDLLNEGVDVPDVNILCFARVTHSRRIFIQQLGRGLRIREGKSHVEVLDFVSDIRRMAAFRDLRQSVAAREVDIVEVPRNQFLFESEGGEDLLREWVNDVADLATASDQFRLNFPPREFS